MNIFTLRIKKQFFDEIKSGKKTKEYRSASPYYLERFLSKPTHLKLHYQGGVFLLVKIENIKIINKPDFLKNIGIQFTDKVFEISLSNPQTIKG